jgi:hypothetical protein
MGINTNQDEACIKDTSTYILTKARTQNISPTVSRRKSAPGAALPRQLRRDKLKLSVETFLLEASDHECVLKVGERSIVKLTNS